jgi:hypothetical protein
MNNKIYKIIAVILTSILLVSCSDEFVDLKPIGAINSGSYYSSVQQAETAVTAAYSTFCKTTAWDRDVIMIFGDVTSDDAESGGDFENEVPDIEVFNRFGSEILTSSSNLDAMYGILYRGIYFANVAMERIPDVLDLDPDATEEFINLRIAEMKFIRAINTLYLTHIFGEVPLVDHVLNPSEYSIPRATFRQLFDFIEKDLLEAIEVLPEKSELEPEDIGRATKGACRGLLARVYLFESSYAHYYSNDERFEGLNERWQDVLDVCREIINPSGSLPEYRLVGAEGDTYVTWHGTNTNGYRYMFTIEGDNNDESLFEVQFIADGANYADTRAGSLVQWVSPRYYTGPNGEQLRTPMWGLGWPTQSIYDEYEDGDIRLQVAISEPGDSMQVIRQGATTSVPINFNNTETGYYQNKYSCAVDQFIAVIGHAWQKSAANAKIIRLADVYLMAAEAAIMLENNNAARGYINAVRSRARVCGGGDSPADLEGTVTINNLIHERRVELAFEGRRFFDLVRWNLAVDKINGETAGGFPIIFESPKHDFMPLPDYEITTNSAVEQKYGW